MIPRPENTSESVQEDTLRDQLEDYRAIFEATGDGVIIADMDGNLVDVNPALCRMHGYSREEMLRLYPTEFIHPEYHGAFTEYMASLNDERAYRTAALDVRKDGTAFPVEVNGTLFTYRGRRHILGIVRDVSERAQVEEELRERERQYRGIFTSTSDGMMIVNMDGYVVEANRAACEMYGYAYDEFIGLHVDVLTHPSYHQDPAEALKWISAGHEAVSRGLNVRRDGSTFYVDGRGAMFTYHGKPHTLAVVRDVTEQVLAEERLEQRVRERTREFAALLDVSRNVASTLQLQPLLDLILDQLKTVVDYSGAAILVVDGNDARIVGFRSPRGREYPPQMQFTMSGYDSALSVRNAPSTMIIDDIHGDTPHARELRHVLGDSLPSYYTFVHSWMAVPMTVKDQVIGYVHLAHDVPSFYTSHHAELALAIAQQAAIAIENARLYEEAQQVAVLQERQRLSRELHDSVSQALYGIALGAKTARASVDPTARNVAEPLDFVLAQTDRGLAEMRALLFELRPESLELEGLVAALQKQAAAIEAQFEIPVETTLFEEPSAPLPVKEALYRIGQEALHNAVKHAQPSGLAVQLERIEGNLVLEVRDDGVGFDPSGDFPGHLGLRSMQERVIKVGGTLEVESTPRQGTCVRATIQCAETTTAS